MKVEMIKHPTPDDWKFCRKVALATMGKESDNVPSCEWKEKILRAEHSPIRTLWFAFELTIPYWVSVHLVRHHVGFEHFVQSQRDDRSNNDVPRSDKAQGEMVKHTIMLNAQAFINLCHARMCNQASPETRQVVWEMRRQALTVCPEFVSVLVPRCVYRAGHCTEMKPCEMRDKYQKAARDPEEDDLK